jgi:hypothetical protein
MHFTSSIIALWATLASAATIPSLVRRQNAVGDISFPVEKVTLKNARIAERYEARVAGFVIGQGNETASFDKVSGANWVEVSQDGVISGTPAEASEGVTKVTIQARSASQSTATLKIAITVRKADEPLLNQLTVLSYNLWKGGSNVNNYHEKQLSFILESGADVIGLQESVDGGHAQRLADALGYGVWATKQSASILSRYPILERYNQTTAGLGVRINLNGDSNDKREIMHIQRRIHTVRTASAATATASKKYSTSKLSPGAQVRWLRSSRPWRPTWRTQTTSLFYSQAT